MEKIQYGQYEVPSSDIMVNFGVGQPSNSILPLDIIKDGAVSFDAVSSSGLPCQFH